MATQHQLRVHFGLAVTDAKAGRARLGGPGRRLIVEEPQPDGSQLIMMRDP